MLGHEFMKGRAASGFVGRQLTSFIEKEPLVLGNFKRALFTACASPKTTQGTQWLFWHPLD